MKKYFYFKNNPFILNSIYSLQQNKILIKNTIDVRKLKCTINNTLDDNNLKWKTTKDSYCEYILTKEEIDYQKKIHNIIISNNDIYIDQNIIDKSIAESTNGAYYDDLNLTKNKLNKANKYIQKFLNNIKNIINKTKHIPIINNIYNQFQYIQNIHIFMSPIHERVNNEKLLSNFQINKDDVRQILYFLCIHIWIYSSKLNKLNKTHLKVLLWEKLWDYYRGLIIKHKIPEFSFNTYLINMQEYTLGFCVGLDECLNKEYYAGKIHYLLFHHIYNSDEIYKNSSYLLNLTIYCIRMYYFIYYLPDFNFLEAKFIWPDII